MAGRFSLYPAELGEVVVEDIAAPAVGNNPAVYTVAAGRVERLVGYVNDFVADATVVSRNFWLRLRDAGGQERFAVWDNNSITAGQTRNIRGIISAGFAAPINPSTFTFFGLPVVDLMPEWVLDVRFNAIVAGDQPGATYLTLIRWRL